MGSALSDKDVNALVQNQDASAATKDAKTTAPKSLEYHRQVLQSKLEEEKYGPKAPATTATTKNTVTTSAFTSTATASGTCNTASAATRVQNHPQSRLLANIGGVGDRQQQYISPSDNIMSPCTAKLNALKGRVAGR